jgi:hypothetical protein
MTDWMKGQPPQDPPAGDNPPVEWSVTITGEHTDEEVLCLSPEDQIDVWDEAGQALLGAAHVTLEELVAAHVAGLDAKQAEHVANELRRGLKVAEAYAGDHSAALGALESIVKLTIDYIAARRSS